MRTLVADTHTTLAVLNFDSKFSLVMRIRLSSEPIPVSHIVINPAPSRAPIISAVKWILHKDPISGHEEYIKLVEPQQNVIDTVEKIDTNPYLLTTYNINDYVLRRYPSSKIGGG